MRIVFIAFALLCITAGYAQQPTMELIVLQAGTPTSIRGLSVVNDETAWVSGSDGWIGCTADHGATWRWQQVAGHETTDFRDIEAFSPNEAVIISAGSPLVILRTEDGGQTWRESHRDERPDIFFDGMDFWSDHHGIAYGDPIGGMMQLLVTADGGVHWQAMSEVANIQLAAGEAGFAASGTGIRTLEDGRVFIATGGSQARLFCSADAGRTWTVNDCPIIQGTASTGIFSIAFRDGLHGVAVGGDYERDEETDRAVYVTADGGMTWTAPQAGTRGFRSAVEYLTPDLLVATGTSGVDVSFDGGVHWQALSGESFHVVRKAKHGNWVVFAGANGCIATLSGTLGTSRR